MAAREKMTLEAFKQFVEAPENSDRLFELINGEIVEVMPGRASNSQIHSVITGEVRPFCKANKIPCYTTNADGAFDVQGQVFAPDFAYKQTPMSSDYPDPVPPLWAVEVISPTDEVGHIRAKRNAYLQASILYWEIYPEAQSIDIYVPGQPVKTYGVNDILDVGDLIPGFKLAVRELFEQ